MKNVIYAKVLLGLFVIASFSIIKFLIAYQDTVFLSSKLWQSGTVLLWSREINAAEGGAAAAPTASRSYSSSSSSSENVSAREEQLTFETNHDVVSNIVADVEKANVEVLALCPDQSPHRVGFKYVLHLSKQPQNEETIENNNPLVARGGHYSPRECRPKFKIAIIIPFRKRDLHLMYFLQYMHPLLQRKQLDYKIFIVNQYGEGAFNRAKLMNVGFAESVQEGFDCFVFHDVDMILESDLCPIACDRGGPIHLGAYVDKFDYKTVMGAAYLGGVSLFSKKDFLKVNGMSNSFWGWGGEDDESYMRTVRENLKVRHYRQCRYSMIKHQRDRGNSPNPRRFALLNKQKIQKNNYKIDGINSLKYKVVERTEHSLYTNITVDLLGPK